MIAQVTGCLPAKVFGGPNSPKFSGIHTVVEWLGDFKSSALKFRTWTLFNQQFGAWTSESELQRVKTTRKARVELHGHAEKWKTMPGENAKTLNFKALSNLFNGNADFVRIFIIWNAARAMYLNSEFQSLKFWESESESLRFCRRAWHSVSEFYFWIQKINY